MREVVYVDILIFENFFMNYLLLYIINRFCRCKAKWYRITIAALIGALYVLILFFPSLHIFYSMIMKIMVSMLMIVLVFSPYKLKEFFRLLILFYVETFILGGSILGIFYINNHNVEVSYGIMQISNISPGYIICGSLLAILLVKLGFDFFENYYLQENNTVELEIILGEKCCNVTALIDTGNSLKDPISNLPIIVVYIKAVANLLPNDIKLNNATNNLDDDEIIKRILSSSLKSRVRIIPYKALGTDNGVLTGIRVDYIVLKSKNKKNIIKNAIIALYTHPISNQGDYEALAYPEILK